MHAQTAIGLALTLAILCVGCMETYGQKYQQGDIVTFDNEKEYQKVAYVILDYNKKTDEYLLTFIHRDGLGRWTRASIDSKKWEDRVFVEYFYDVKLGHVDINDLKMLT